MSIPSTPSDAALIDPKDKLKITKLEYFVLNNRRFFLKIHTNAGIVGAGEPIPKPERSRFLSRDDSGRIISPPSSTFSARSIRVLRN